MTAILAAILPFLTIQPCMIAQMKVFLGLCNNVLAFTYSKRHLRLYFSSQRDFGNIFLAAILGAIFPFRKIQPCMIAQMKGFFGLCNNGVAFTYWKPSFKVIFLRKMRFCYISVTAILGAILPFLKIQPCMMAQMKGFFGLCNNGVAFTYWKPSSKAIFFITKRFLKYFCGGHFGRHFAIS